MAATLKVTQDQDAVAARINTMLTSINEQLKAKDYAGVIATVDGGMASELPDRQKQLVQRAKFAALLHIDENKARDYGREVISGIAVNLQMKRMMGLIIADVGTEGVALSKETYALGVEWLDSAFATAPSFAGNPDFDIARGVCGAGLNFLPLFLK